MPREVAKDGLGAPIGGMRVRVGGKMVKHGQDMAMDRNGRLTR